MNKTITIKSDEKLFNDIHHLILETKKEPTFVTDALLIKVYWHVGKRIHEEALAIEPRKQVITALSKQLKPDFKEEFSAKNLHHMLRFSEVYDQEDIVKLQLSWKHICILIDLQDPFKRNFYAEMSQVKGWSFPDLKDALYSKLFENTEFKSVEYNESHLFKIACGNLFAAKKLFTNHWHIWQGCFLLHLSVELILKGCSLHLNNKHSKNHNLEELVDDLGKNIAIITEFRTFPKELQQFHNYRYKVGSGGTHYLGLVECFIECIFLKMPLDLKNIYDEIYKESEGDSMVVLDPEYDYCWIPREDVVSDGS